MIVTGNGLHCKRIVRSRSFTGLYPSTALLILGLRMKATPAIPPFSNIMRNANLDLWEQGIIGGRKVNNLRYADDNHPYCKKQRRSSPVDQTLKESSAREGLLLNVKKTKIMTTAPGLNEFTLGTEKVEVVDCFAFLGSTIDRKGGCSNDIRKRLALGRAAMTKLTKIMKDRDVKTTTKTRIVRTMVFPVATYGCESWTLSKKDVRQIDAFELWVWKRLLRTPLTERKTNEDKFIGSPTDK